MEEKKKYTEYTEEDLRDVQRREAIEGSETYDIDDDVYERGPLSREYVADEKIVKKANLDDGTRNTAKKPPQIVDDGNDGDSSDRQKSPKEIYAAAQPPKDAYQSLDQNPGMIPEKKRRYVDKNELIREERQNNKISVRTTKSTKTAKPAKPVWNGTVVSCIAVVLSLILAVLLFFGVSGFVTVNQRMNAQKQAFIRATEAAVLITSAENSILAEFSGATENFVHGTMDYAAYCAEIDLCSAKIAQETAKVASLPSSTVEELNIKTAVLDFVRHSQDLIDNVKEAKDQGETAVKEYILYYVSNLLQIREERYNNFTAVVLDGAEQLDIRAVSSSNGFSFDVQH